MFKWQAMASTTDNSSVPESAEAPLRGVTLLSPAQRLFLNPFQLTPFRTKLLSVNGSGSLWVRTVLRVNSTTAWSLVVISGITAQPAILPERPQLVRVISRFAEPRCLKVVGWPDLFSTFRPWLMLGRAAQPRLGYHVGNAQSQILGHPIRFGSSGFRFNFNFHDKPCY